MPTRTEPAPLNRWWQSHRSVALLAGLFAVFPFVLPYTAGQRTGRSLRWLPWPSTCASGTAA